MSIRGQSSRVRCLICGQGHKWTCDDCRRRQNERVKRLRRRFA